MNATRHPRQRGKLQRIMFAGLGLAFGSASAWLLAAVDGEPTARPGVEGVTTAQAHLPAAAATTESAIGLASLGGERVLEPALQPVPSEESSPQSDLARENAELIEEGRTYEIQLCQGLGPAAPHSPRYVESYKDVFRQPWSPCRCTPWQQYAQGEYIGHARDPHVAVYRVRADDQIRFTYRLTREETTRPYELNVGDEIRIESITEDKLSRSVVVQPDGTITLPLLGQIKATHRTIAQLRDEVETAYAQHYREPSITITPVKVNTKLEDLRAVVDNRAGIGGQGVTVRVTPDGKLSLPAIGVVYVQGLSLVELKQEIDARYRAKVEGIEVNPDLTAAAPRNVYVLGEVRTPGRYTLTGPTSLTQSIALAGGWNRGARLWQIIVLRRADDWRLLATTVNLQTTLEGGFNLHPRGEIWLSDSDVVIVPKSAIVRIDDFVDLVFTKGIYGVFPFQGISINMSKVSSL